MFSFWSFEICVKVLHVRNIENIPLNIPIVINSSSGKLCPKLPILSTEQVDILSCSSSNFFFLRLNVKQVYIFLGGSSLVYWASVNWSSTQLTKLVLTIWCPSNCNNLVTITQGLHKALSPDLCYKVLDIFHLSSLYTKDNLVINNIQTPHASMDVLLPSRHIDASSVLSTLNMLLIRFNVAWHFVYDQSIKLYSLFSTVFWKAVERLST